RSSDLTPVQGGDHGITQVREEIAQIEGKFSPCLQKVERKGMQVGSLRPKHDHKVRQFALVPLRPILRLVSKAEGNVVLKWDDLKPTVIDALDDAFLNQQS